MSLKTRQLTAAGGVIFRIVGGHAEVALCFKRREKIWCLPKGLIEQGETAEESALREVKEETGLKGEIIKKIGQVKYGFFGKGQHYFKTVHFYLLEYSEGSMDNHDSEVDKVEWFSISKTLQILAYVNERKILRKAKNMVKKWSQNILAGKTKNE
jgi:8-oxo-dGTP diphosphatase